MLLLFLGLVSLLFEVGLEPLLGVSPAISNLFSSKELISFLPKRLQTQRMWLQHKLRLPRFETEEVGDSREWKASVTFVSGETSLMSRTFHFYLADLAPGKHQVKLQGSVLGGVSPAGEIRARTLIVIALPK